MIDALPQALSTGKRVFYRSLKKKRNIIEYQIIRKSPGNTGRKGFALKRQLRVVLWFLSY